MTKRLGSGSIAVYDVIERLYSLEGQSPSIVKIMEETGFRSKATIGHHLDRLEQAGWIIREHKKQHAIVPVREPRIYYRIRNLAANSHGWMCPTHLVNADKCPDCDRSVDACPYCDSYAVTDTQPKSNVDRN